MGQLIVGNRQGVASGASAATPLGLSDGDAPSELVVDKPTATIVLLTKKLFGYEEEEIRALLPKAGFAVRELEEADNRFLCVELPANWHLGDTDRDNWKILMDASNCVHGHVCTGRLANDAERYIRPLGGVTLSQFAASFVVN